MMRSADFNICLLHLLHNSLGIPNTFADLVCFYLAILSSFITILATAGDSLQTKVPAFELWDPKYIHIHLSSTMIVSLLKPSIRL